MSATFLPPMPSSSFFPQPLLVFKTGILFQSLNYRSGASPIFYSSRGLIVTFHSSPSLSAPLHPCQPIQVLFSLIHTLKGCMLPFLPTRPAVSLVKLFNMVPRHPLGHQQGVIIAVIIAQSPDSSRSPASQQTKTRPLAGTFDCCKAMRAQAT